MSAVILRPLINEKSTNLIKENLYTFEVKKDATKKEIEKVVKAKFNVDVLSVKTVNIKGKVKMQRNKRAFYTLPGIRKAIVQLKKGQKIALFEQVSAEEENEVQVKTAESEEKKPQVKEKKSLFGTTKVKVEKAQDKEETAKKADTKRPGKTSQKEKKK